MTNIFLRAKHWQLFILMYGVPILLQFKMMAWMFSNFAVTENPDPKIMFDFIKFFPFVMILYMVVSFGWFWSTGVGLQKKVPVNVKLKVGRFKALLIIQNIYILLFLIYFYYMLNELLKPDPEINFGFIAGLIFIILPLHLLFMFCIFYSMYFVAKTIKTVEFQREVSFGDFVGEFFLIWFYPIGIWILQPKINKMVEA